MLESDDYPLFYNLTLSNFRRIVGTTVQGWVVYFTLDNHEGETEFKQVNREFPMFETLIDQMNGAFKFGVFKVDTSEFQELQKIFKLSSSLKKGKPELRFFPNKFTGQLKIGSSVGLAFNPASDDLEPIFSQIHEVTKSDISIESEEVFEEIVNKYIY